VDCWAALEVAPWVGAGIKRSDLSDGLYEASGRDPSLFTFHIRGGTVELVKVRDDLLTPFKFEFCNARALVLRGFLQQVVDGGIVGEMSQVESGSRLWALGSRLTLVSGL